VLAAAIAAKAELIVTLNVRHFPAVVLEPLGIEAVTPDRFLSRQAPTFASRCMEFQIDPP